MTFSLKALSLAAIAATTLAARRNGASALSPDLRDSRTAHFA